MTVSRDEVIWAYRCILGREPENEEAISIHRAAEDMAAMRRVFLGSPEYLSSELSSSGVGQHRGVSEISVETDGTPAQIAAMLAGIATAWRTFGENDPHWSVLTGDEFRRDRIDASLENFYASGHDELVELLNPLSRAGLLKERLGKVLDFGCGVGRVSLALATKADLVVGVDISPAHLRHANARASDTQVTNVRFEAIDRVEDLDRYTGFDLVTTVLVLQHNPPPVIAVIIGKLLAALAPGGIAVFQVPVYLSGYRFDIGGYLAGDKVPMEMNVLPQHALFRVIDDRDCRVIEVREDTRIIDMGGISLTLAVQRR